MGWKEYLKSQGYTDAEITKMETEFGADKMSKALEGPIRDKAAAEAAALAAKTEKEEFERFYNDDVLPKVSGVYQDAIAQRTRAAALEERLKAAKEYGFLSEVDPKTGVIPGVPPGTPVIPNPVPGSPAVPGAPASSALDPRYVASDMFTKAVNDIPDMLGRLTKMSNEHFSLFGSPLLDVDALITEARAQKKNVVDIWSAKYKVPEKRAEIEAAAKAKHDKEVGDEAIRKYMSEHGMPFTAPGRPSVASHFTPASTEEARHPWKGSRQRKEERKQSLLTEFQKAQVGTRVQ